MYKLYKHPPCRARWETVQDQQCGNTPRRDLLTLTDNWEPRSMPTVQGPPSMMRRKGTCCKSFQVCPSWIMMRNEITAIKHILARDSKVAGSQTAVNMQMQWQRRVNRNFSRPQRHALGMSARCAQSDSPMVRPKEPWKLLASMWKRTSQVSHRKCRPCC